MFCVTNGGVCFSDVKNIFPWGLTLGENRKIRLSNSNCIGVGRAVSTRRRFLLACAVVEWTRHVRVVVIYCTPARFSKG
jgi:hypothetical protein